MADIANHRLSARVNLDMLDRHVLLSALAPLSRQGLDLHGEGAHEFVCQVPQYVQPFDPVTLIRMPSDGVTSASD